MHTVQAMQGLPGYRGSDNGIGIGFGLHQLAQARAQAQLNAQQAALASSGLLPGHLNGVLVPHQSGNGTDRDSAMTGTHVSLVSPVAAQGVYNQAL